MWMWMGWVFNPGSYDKLFEVLVNTQHRKKCLMSESKYKEMIMTLGRVTEYEVEEVAVRAGFNRQWPQAPSKPGGSKRSHPKVGDLDWAMMPFSRAPRQPVFPSRSAGAPATALAPAPASALAPAATEGVPEAAPAAAPAAPAASAPAAAPARTSTNV